MMIETIFLNTTFVRVGVRKSHFFMQDKSCYKLAKNYVLWNNDPFQLL